MNIDCPAFTRFFTAMESLVTGRLQFCISHPKVLRYVILLKTYTISPQYNVGEVKCWGLCKLENAAVLILACKMFGLQQ